MKFLIIDEANYLSTLVGCIKDEGFDATLITSTKEYVKGADVVLANTLKPIYRPKHIFIGLTESIFTVLIDRDYMLKVLKAMEINIPSIYIAKEGEVSTDIIEDKKYAIETIAFPSYFNIGMEDALAVLKFSNGNKLTTLVREVPYKFELEIEGWFNGAEIMIPSYIIFDDCILHPLSRSSNLYKETLKKLEKALKKMDYKGPISLTLGVDDKNVYSIQINCIFRPMVFEAMKKIGDNLRAVITGAKNMLNMYDGWTEQLPLVNPLCFGSYNFPLLGYRQANKKHIWIEFVEKNGEYFYNTNGYITARGQTPRECSRRLVRTRQNLVIPFSINCPTAKRVNERYKLLKEWGWI